MKFYAGVILFAFSLCSLPGCERAERAVDLYKKTQNENRQNEEGRQVEPRRHVIEDRIKDAYNAKDKEYGEKEETAEIR